MAQWYRFGFRSKSSRVQAQRPPYSVLEQDTLIFPKYWIMPRKHWLRPKMTEILLTGTLNKKTNKRPKDSSLAKNLKI